MSRDARRFVCCLLRSLVALAALLPAASAFASYTTANFVVTAPTEEFAKQVGDLAERYRDEIAIEWTGKKLPRWYKPCPITVKVGQIGAGGATTFCFDRGEVFGWRMNIQGTEERILDSVLPHEVSHTVFACHFRRPLPRWADEGAATLVEHESERRRQMMLLNQVIRTSQRIPLKQLLSMKDYPKDMQQVLTLYAEGYSLAEFFVQQGGKARYLQFLEDAHHRNWDEALKKHYEFQDVAALEKVWTDWVVAGSPPLARRDGSQLAQNEPKRRQPENTLIRSQTPDEPANDVGDRSRMIRNDAADSMLAAPSPRNGNVAAPVRNADQLAAAPGTERGDNRQWDALAETKRRPRPAPLVGRIEFTSNDSRKAPANLNAALEEPPFMDELSETLDEPRFEEGARPLAESRTDARAIPDFRNSPRFEDVESLEDGGEAGSRSPDWSAFPQARATSGATKKGSLTSPLSP